jgi:sugar-specific transcriptional regulator TrmB
MKAVLDGNAGLWMFRDYGLSEYAARIHFVVLTFGKSKVTTLTRRTYIPQSKGYEVLDRLIKKGLPSKSAKSRRPIGRGLLRG